MTTPVLSYKPTGSGVHVDLARLVASRMLVQSNSGGGKSRAIHMTFFIAWYFDPSRI